MDEDKTPSNLRRGIVDYDFFNKETCLKQSESAYKNIKLELDLKKAMEDADIVIESMAEDLKEKIAFYAFYKMMAPYLRSRQF